MRAEEIARWAAELYPRRTYPAIALGSSNGALVHLYAALGIPWLPQTVLIPVRQNVAGPDQPQEAMQFGAEHAPRLVFLQACEGGVVEAATTFAGMAPLIAERNAPAVVAMQYPVFNPAATSLSLRVY